jgi:hypothetical protein
MFVRVDLANGTHHQMDLADRYEEISECVLHQGVPQDVVLQFETAKNIYLYSWFVYRFFNVAESQSYACLELALRERLKNEIVAGKLGSNRPGLRLLLGYAADRRLIKNEGFAIWRDRGEINSRHRVEMEDLRKMAEGDLDRIALDHSRTQVTSDDLDWDYVGVIVKTLPVLRNGYAHGSTDLHNWSLQMIRIVGEIVNQLFELPKGN